MAIRNHKCVLGSTGVPRCVSATSVPPPEAFLRPRDLCACWLNASTTGVPRIVGDYDGAHVWSTTGDCTCERPRDGLGIFEAEIQTAAKPQFGNDMNDYAERALVVVPTDAYERLWKGRPTPEAFRRVDVPVTAVMYKVCPDTRDSGCLHTWWMQEDFVQLTTSCGRSGYAAVAAAVSSTLDEEGVLYRPVDFLTHASLCLTQAVCWPCFFKQCAGSQRFASCAVRGIPLTVLFPKTSVLQPQRDAAAARVLAERLEAAEAKVAEAKAATAALKRAAGAVKTECERAARALRLPLDTSSQLGQVLWRMKSREMQKKDARLFTKLRRVKSA